jgi:cytochrome c-type biogenesis protein CcmH
MSLQFWLAALTMAVGAFFFLLFLPQKWRRSRRGESTADWVRLRKSELSGAEGQLLDEVELRALEDLSTLGNDSDKPEAKPIPLWWLAPLLVVSAVAVYQLLGSFEDVLITDELANLDPNSEAAVSAVIQRIEARAEARPDNADYLSLLGEYHAARGEHQSALEAYEQLIKLLPDNPQMLGRAAQAEFLATGELGPVARARAEAALAINPNQRAALGTLGMGAFEAGEYRAAIGFWQRMLAMETPGTPGYQMMQQVIAEAAQRAGLVPEALAQSGAESAADSGIGISVTVEAPDSASIAATDTVFILARPSGAQSRMPTAVVRRPAEGWPMTVRLTDSDAMAGQKLSSLDAVEVEVQVSPSGQPGRNSASWFAVADNVVPSNDTELTLTLQPVQR